jgi:MraZ protein
MWGYAFFSCGSLGSTIRTSGVSGEFWGIMGENTENSSVELTLGFTGNFTVKLDSALRVAIPSKFKEVLDRRYGTSSSHVVLVPDSGKVKVLPLPVWERMQQKLEELSEFDPNADDYRTFVFGNMSVCQLDAQNRVKLTGSLRDLAELDKEAVVVGQQDRMEIWDAAKWKEFNAGTARNFKAVMTEVFRNRQLGSK